MEPEQTIMQVMREFSGAPLDDETCRSILIRLKHFGVPATLVEPYEDEYDSTGICITCVDGTQYLLAQIAEDDYEDEGAGPEANLTEYGV